MPAGPTDFDERRRLKSLRSSDLETDVKIENQMTESQPKCPAGGDRSPYSTQNKPLQLHTAELDRFHQTQFDGISVVFPERRHTATNSPDFS